MMAPGRGLNFMSFYSIVFLLFYYWTKIYTNIFLKTHFLQPWLVHLVIYHVKKGFATPIYKKGDPSLLSKFSPISIFPMFSKIETMIKKQLVAYFESNNLFKDAHHGFKSGRSTTSALQSLVNEITDTFEDNEAIHLSKAFDVFHTTS